MFGIISVKKIVRAGIVVSAIVMAFGVLSTTSIVAQGPKGKILNRMDAHYKGLSSLQCDVTMVKHNTQLDETDINEGSTTFLPAFGKRPMYVRLDWVKPLEEHIVVRDKNYELYTPGRGQVIIGTTGSAKKNPAAGGALAFLSMSKEQLTANYNVVVVNESEQIKDGTNTFHLLLTPKVATSYKTADLWVDGDGMPRQAKITEKNDDTTTVLLTNIQKNVKVNASIFTLNYDKKKVKVIKG